MSESAAVNTMYKRHKKELEELEVDGVGGLRAG